MAVLSQPAIRQNPAGFCLILTEEIRGICIFLNIHGRQKNCKRIGAGAGGGAAGALDINSHDAPRKAAPRKNFETRVFFEAENGRIIARFLGDFLRIFRDFQQALHSCIGKKVIRATF